MDGMKGLAMNRTTFTLVLSIGLLSQAHATTVPGKGGSCAAIWDTGTGQAAAGATPTRPFSLICQDGDPTCDTDGVPDGTCQIALTACVGQVSDACPAPPTLRGPLKFRSLIGGVPKRNVIRGFVAPSQGCGSTTLVLVRKRVPKNPKKPLKKLLSS